MTTLNDLNTPILVLDKGKLQSNLDRMAGHMKTMGVKMRPHMKTAKSSDVARMGRFEAVTVSTLKEAEYFFEHGISDILYGVGMAPNKLDRAARLIARGADLKIIVDTAAAAEAVIAHDGDFKVVIEIDSGAGRGGVPGDSVALIDLAKLLGTRLVGIMTHAGQSYMQRKASDFARVAEVERDAVVLASVRLMESGFDPQIISVGSTPTMTFVKDLTGATEARPGVYMFQDLFQVGIGVAQVEDIAVSVLSSVIGGYAGNKHVLIDAGALALSKDRATQAVRPDWGYGRVCGLDGVPIGDLYVESVSQEHGSVTSRLGDLKVQEVLKMGDKVRILPNHVCMTAAAYDSYQVIDGGDEVLETWERVNGW